MVFYSHVEIRCNFTDDPHIYIFEMLKKRSPKLRIRARIIPYGEPSMSVLS